MEDKKYFWGVVFICLSVISSSIYAEDVCVTKSPCSCVFSNGTGIDISESAKSSSFYEAQMYQIRKNGSQYELSTYQYHPCIDALPNVNSSAPGSTCNVPLSLPTQTKVVYLVEEPRTYLRVFYKLCRQVNTMDLQPNQTGTYKLIPGNYEYMGSSQFTNFTADGHSITYFNGPSASIVMLVCADIDDKLEVSSLEEPNKIVLSFYSRNACLRQIESPGRSTGSTLLIIFFSLVIFYLVLGVCTKKFLMGATGVEVVPNLAFWSDLPNLIKDGWAFTLSGFKLPARGAPATSPDPNSYDSI